MLWYKKTSWSRTTHHVSACLPAVVKPSGHHLKLALKMRNLAKAMFKPMRWGNLVGHFQLVKSMKSHKNMKCWVRLHSMLLQYSVYVMFCVNLCQSKAPSWPSVMSWLYIAECWNWQFDRSLCVHVCVCQAAEGRGDSRRRLLFRWPPETQCRDCCFSSGQVQPHYPSLFSRLLSHCC